MKKQQTNQSETSAGQAKKGNGVKRLPMAALILGVIATAFVIIWLTKFAAASSSRLSTPLEIAAQKEFQDKWNTAQEEFQLKVDAATIEAEQKSDSTPSEIAAQKEFQAKLNTAREEFQQKVDAATIEAVQCIKE